MASSRMLPRRGLITVALLGLIGLGLWLAVRSGEGGESRVAVGVDLPPTTEPVSTAPPPAPSTTASSTTASSTTGPAPTIGPTSVPPVPVPPSAASTIPVAATPTTIRSGGAGGDLVIEYVDRQGGVLPDAPKLVSADSSTMGLPQSDVMLAEAAEQLFGSEPLGGRPFRLEASVCEPDCEEVVLPLDLTAAEATQISLDILPLGFELGQAAMSDTARWRVHVDPANGMLARLESFDGSSATAFFVHRIVFFPPAAGDGGAVPPQI